jgi:hypothetical protein
MLLASMLLLQVSQGAAGVDGDAAAPTDSA